VFDLYLFYLYVGLCKVSGDLGTVASVTMGEQRGTPMPVELHCLGYLL